jgi:hypothetical protein
MNGKHNILPVGKNLCAEDISGERNTNWTEDQDRSVPRRKIVSWDIDGEGLYIYIYKPSP